MSQVSSASVVQVCLLLLQECLVKGGGESHDQEGCVFLRKGHVDAGVPKIWTEQGDKNLILIQGDGDKCRYTVIGIL